MKKNIFFYLLLVILAVYPTGCGSEIESPVPDFPVYLELDLVSKYPNFKGPNQALTFEKPVLVTDRVGFAGILVYNGFDGKYYAFDMCCPYEVKPTVKVYPNDVGQAVCKSCKTVYDISYGIGNPISGPCKEVLRRYHANLTNQRLIITP